ncbi:response regulator [Novispirillum itersonii]|uniref:CheY-like chemotaxis protein n=1 Tax=Novispirillum itersonii TaxID=189 RepID=A0A7X0DL46_NOVIT|nr:response regulator [Novispirillum itersonii]MBB6209611.1 CheY-like chemotaxis protein [Novispirillum itersonii]
MNEFSLQSIRVLVVDDNPHFRRLLVSVLASMGCRMIEEAADGADALKALGHFPADIALVDWHMAPMDGLDFTRVVRTSPDSPNPHLPILMLSGHTELRLVLEARDAGVHEFIAKPISAKTLQTRLQATLLSPRPFVRSGSYFGPDRRRRQVPLKGPDRRRKA